MYISRCGFRTPWGFGYRGGWCAARGLQPARTRTTAKPINGATRVMGKIFGICDLNRGDRSIAPALAANSSQQRDTKECSSRSAREILSRVARYPPGSRVLRGFLERSAHRSVKNARF